jgi:hypothetical protein
LQATRDELAETLASDWQRGGRRDGTGKTQRDGNAQNGRFHT